MGVLDQFSDNDPLSCGTIRANTGERSIGLQGTNKDRDETHTMNSPQRAQTDASCYNTLRASL